jgi:hypothetical protein
MGDPRVYGRCYVTPVGRGIVYGEQVDSASTSVETHKVINNIPAEYGLFQNYPNPFNPATTISFSLPTGSFVSLKVFDLIGREVAIIVSQELFAGTYTRQWNATNMSSGIYFYRLQAGSFTETKKLILMK